MSEHGLLAFLFLLSQNENLRNKVKKSSKKEILKLAEELNCELKEEEAEFIQNELIEEEEDVLSLEILDKIVGGSSQIEYLIEWLKMKYFDF